jgi:hypothetical protein
MSQEETKTITLSKVVFIGKGDAAIPYEKLELREPMAGELEKAAREVTSIGVTITLTSLVAGVPRLAIEKISRRDLMAANNFFEGFIDDGQTESAGQN